MWIFQGREGTLSTKSLDKRRFETKCPGCMAPMTGRVIQLIGGQVTFVARCRCGHRIDMDWRANDMRTLMVEHQIYEVA